MILQLEPEIAKEFGEQDVFSTIMQLDGKIYRSVKNRKTIEVTIANNSYFIKQHYGTTWKEIVKNLITLRMPVIGAKPEWQAIKKLAALNILATPLAGYGERYFNPLKRESFLITKALNADSVENLILGWKNATPEFSYKLKVIKQVAHIAKTMHTNGISHRDFYLCHLILDHNSKDPEIYVLDLHRAQIRNKLSQRTLIKELGALYFSTFNLDLNTKDILRFLRDYFDAPLRKTLQSKLLNKIAQRAFKLYYKIYTRKQSITEKNWRKFTVCRNEYPSPNMLELLKNPDKFITTDKLLTLEGSCAVAKVELENQTVALKRFNLRKNILHKLSRAIRRTRAKRSWGNSLFLLANKIPTPKPIAIIENKFGPLRGKTYFISKYIAGETSDNYFSEEKDLEQLQTIAIKLVKSFQLLRRYCLKHRDTKACNFIIANNQAYFIDLDGMRRLSKFRYKRNKAYARSKQRFMRDWKNHPQLEELFNNLFDKYEKISYPNH